MQNREPYSRWPWQGAPARVTPSHRGARRDPPSSRRANGRRVPGPCNRDIRPEASDEYFPLSPAPASPWERYLNTFPRSVGEGLATAGGSSLGPPRASCLALTTCLPPIHRQTRELTRAWPGGVLLLMDRGAKNVASRSLIGERARDEATLERTGPTRRTVHPRVSRTRRDPQRDAQAVAERG